MKVLGLSFGRKGGNCDIVVKEALVGAKTASTETEVRFVNTVNLKIDRCTGCGACDRRREKGGPSRCVIKDDFPFLENEILDADAMVVAAPVYVLGPVGQYKNLCDRIGPSHDRAFMTKENERRVSAGIPPLDDRLFKDHFVGLVSVGGARTENWTSFGLSGMHLLTFSMQMTVVDQINLYAMGDRVNPAFHPELMERLRKMGKNISSVVGTPRLAAPWFGDEEGICPLCHCDLLTVKGTTDVQCPVCGIHGTLKVNGDKVNVSYTEAQIDRARQRYGGVEDHCNEINDMVSHAIEKMKTEGGNLKTLLAHQDEIVEVDRKQFVENPNH
jgi:multimeric flavodoxin WrbA